jgi:hypothetical protein
VGPPGDLGLTAKSSLKGRYATNLGRRTRPGSASASPIAVVAAQAARKIDPGDADIPERIRTLASGEAFVSLGGDAPRLLTMP